MLSTASLGHLKDILTSEGRKVHENQELYGTKNSLVQENIVGNTCVWLWHSEIEFGLKPIFFFSLRHIEK